MTTQPTSTSHPKLHNPKTKITLMFEPIEGDCITVWEYSGKMWSVVTSLKKEYARHMWNFHTANGAVRVTD